MEDLKKIILDIFENTINTALNLEGKRIGDARVKDVAEVLKTNQTIVTLNLEGNEIGPDGAKDIAEALRVNQAITTLNINRNQIGHDGVKFIAEVLKVNQYITSIDLAQNHIGSSGAEVIAEALKINQSIKTLSLRANNIGGAGVKYIAKALKKNQSLTTLCLSSNNIGTAGAKDVAEALKHNTSVSTLNLSSNNIGAAGAKNIAEALKHNQFVSTLILTSNNIGTAGGKDIAEALKTNQTISTLYLASNNIGAAGAKDIAQALIINKFITTLYLSNNKIMNDGAKFLAEALQRNQYIATLDVSSNEIRAAGAKDIAEALKVNQSLITLYFCSNEIGDAGARFIAEALKINQNITVITDLNLQNKGIGDAGARVKAEALQLDQPVTDKQFYENKVTDLSEYRAPKHKHLHQKVSNLINEGKKVNEFVPNIQLVKIFEGMDGEYPFAEGDQATITKISDLIRDGNDRLQEQSEKGILLLGNTGAGKSTLAHLLSDRKLQAILDEDTGELVIDALQPHKDIIIGLAASETRIPNKCFHRDVTIWDCPGFYDTDHVQEIANTFYIKRLLETTDKLKFVLVVPEIVLNAANTRGSIFIETLSNFMKCFTDVKAVIGSIAVVFTHVASTKSIHHIKKSIEKVLKDHPGAKAEQAFIQNLKEGGSIHLFYKPSGQGELTTPDLLAKIEANSKYCSVQGDMVNIAISKKAMDCSFHLLKIVGDNFNKILEVIVKGICNATKCRNINPLNVFSENYDLVKNWLPLSIHYNDRLPKHAEDEYFSKLELLVKLQKVFKTSQVVCIPDAITVLQEAVETIAEYAEPGNGDLQRKIQGFGYCLRQQYKYVEFFSGVCRADLPHHLKIETLLNVCNHNVAKNLGHEVCSLSIDETQSDINYFRKAIEYLEKYSESLSCNQSRAVAYSSMAIMAEKNDKKDLLLLYCKKAIEANKHLPKVYDTLGNLFSTKGEYAKAIECYKVVNDAYNITECFKAWLRQNKKCPDITLKQAEYFESIGLFEQAKKYYHYAFSFSQDDDFKVGVLKKIDTIMENTVTQSRNYIARSNEREIYNFSMVNEDFFVEIFDGVDLPSDC